MIKYDNLFKLNFEKQKIQWVFSPKFLVLNVNAFKLGWILAFPIHTYIHTYIYIYIYIYILWRNNNKVNLSQKHQNSIYEQAQQVSQDKGDLIIPIYI